MSTFRVSAFFALALAFSAAAQPIRGRLPLESFTTAQGLANDSITTITTDSRGFVWFGTLDGLSRYDGNHFINYTTADGLPDRMIWSFAEDRRHDMWIGTSEGAAKMMTSAARGPSLFARIAGPARANVDASTLFADRSGTIWTQCGRDLCTVKNGRLAIDESFKRAGGQLVRAIVDTPSGEVWVGTDAGIWCRARDGAWRNIKVQPHRDGDLIGGLLFDRDGHLWITTGFGVIVYTPRAGDPDPRSLAARAGKPLVPGDAIHFPRPGEAIALIVPRESPIIHPTQPYEAHDGAIWIPSYIGLLHVANGRFDFFDSHDGLPPL